MRDPVMDTFKAIQDLIKSELNDILENLPVILSICFVVYIFLEIFVFVLVWLPIPLKIRKQVFVIYCYISHLYKHISRLYSAINSSPYCLFP